MRRGFSLVELSIVLVILGLLTGGILAGQSLIRAAEIRSVAADYQRYSTARYTFRDKYFALPGDFRDATRFWGRLNSNSWCATNSAATVNSTTGVCDGDGDGLLGDSAVASQSSEALQSWRQLAMAGLIEGSYTGIAGVSGGADYDFGINSPSSRISSAGWGANYDDNRAGTTVSLLRFNYRNAMTVGGDDGIWADYPRFKPEEAWNIDTKVDDGKPHVGKMHTYPFGNNCTTAASNTDTTGEYVLTQTSLACTPIFRE